MTSRPLRLVLKGVHFDRFAAGTKTVEFRRAGGRFNARTCRVGRRVVLQRGYTARMLHGVIAGVWPMRRYDVPEGAWEIYPGVEQFLAIRIALDASTESIDASDR